MKPNLEWKRATRNRFGNLVWRSRCGRYRIQESARYIDDKVNVDFSSTYFCAWFCEGPAWAELPVASHGYSKKLRMKTTIYRFRSKTAAQAACNLHARTPRRAKT